MRLASAVLATAIKLVGPASREVVANEDVALIVNTDRSVLEVHLRGQLVSVRHLSQVLDMVPASKQETCPECALTFADARGLSGHRAHKHGVKGATR